LSESSVLKNRTGQRCAEDGQDSDSNQVRGCANDVAAANPLAICVIHGHLDEEADSK
jgi:hypothetical protein